MAISIDAAIATLLQKVEDFGRAVSLYEQAQTGSDTLREARTQIALAIDELVAATIEASTEKDAPVTHCRHCGRACQVDECLDCWRQRQNAR
jgi:hypothetical protein